MVFVRIGGVDGTLNFPLFDRSEVNLLLRNIVNLLDCTALTEGIDR